MILENVEYPVNVGSIFRIADAAQIEELILTGITPTPLNPTIVKVGPTNTEVYAGGMRKRPINPSQSLRTRAIVSSLEITEGASPYYETDWPAKICLVVGHEDHSVTRATLALCDDVIFIPMWGRGLSLNVHVALAVAVFHIRYLGLAGAP